jgi:Strabismus protein.
VKEALFNAVISAKTVTFSFTTNYNSCLRLDLFSSCPQVTRSPDGDSKSYAIGQLSIQRAAVWVLQKYYTEFSIYNPYLEKLPVSKSKKNHSHSSFKFYDVDGGFNNSTLQVVFLILL